MGRSSLVRPEETASECASGAAVRPVFLRVECIADVTISRAESFSPLNAQVFRI
jgi:hypothetical protein